MSRLRDSEQFIPARGTSIHQLNAIMFFGNLKGRFPYEPNTVTFALGKKDCECKGTGVVRLSDDPNKMGVATCPKCYDPE